VDVIIAMTMNKSSHDSFFEDLRPILQPILITIAMLLMINLTTSVDDPAGSLERHALSNKEGIVGVESNSEE
jgi:hypothetical protein